MKSYLFIFKTTPFANHLPQEGLEFALALASFDQNVSLFFTQAGVLQLACAQQPELLLQKDFSKAYQGLDFLDIKIYCDQDSLQHYNLSLDFLKKTFPQAAIIANTEVNALIAQHNIALSL